MSKRRWSSGSGKVRKHAPAKPSSAPLPARMVMAERAPIGLFPCLPGEIIWLRSASRPDHPIIALLFCCPCGCGRVQTLRPLRPERDRIIRLDWSQAPMPEGWQWNDSTEHPSITPGMRSEDCMWAGFLTDGVFTKG